MSEFYVTLSDLHPGSVDKVTLGPFDKVELEMDDLIGYVGEEDERIAEQIEDGRRWYRDGRTYFRATITVGEPDA